MPRKARPKKKSGSKPRAVRKNTVIEDRFNDFTQELEKLGSRFEQKGDHWDSWFHRTFGLVAPLISSVFGLIVLALMIWIIGAINLPLSNVFLSNIGSFISGNIAWFFLIFLFFSYTSYFSKAYPKSYMPFSPLVAAIGITIGFWVAFKAIAIANLSVGSTVLSEVSLFIGTNLFWIFLFFFFVGYLLLLVKTNTGKPIIERKIIMKPAKKQKGIQRLYRSGKDKILGGVCGGIGEYLGIDPVIIRLIWIIATLAWGVGLIAYIIAWIIIPRNPDHRWDD